MRTKQRVAAVIFRKKKFLLIHRQKNAEDYYIFPGGGVEDTETQKEAVIREINEELNLRIKIARKLFEFENLGNKEYYYLIKEFSGRMKVIGDSITNKNIKDSADWYSLEELNKINLLPPKAKRKILNLQRKGLLDS